MKYDTICYGDIMKIGFTGTKRGMTRDQKCCLIGILAVSSPDEFHHGDCVGADEQAHSIATNLTENVIIHPPIKDILRAFCEAKTILPPKDYLDRNHDIVDACDLLVATPCTRYEVTRSGTWATIRYARKRNKQIIIIWPEGDYAKENVEK